MGVKNDGKLIKKAHEKLLGLAHSLISKKYQKIARICKTQKTLKRTP